MVYESTVDTTFGIHYSRDDDRFSIEAVRELPAFSVARLTLGDEDDFILFDNHQAGRVRSISHSGQNKLAITTLSRIIFDEEYTLLCECIKEGSAIYNTPERSGTIIVPYSNARRLGRIALHALAIGASENVIALQRRIIDSLTQTTGGDGDGGYPQLLV